MFDLGLALSTAVLCIFVGTVMAYWYWCLRESSSVLKPLFVSITIFKYSLAAWAFGNSYAIWFYNENPPLTTLAARCAIFIAILIQTRVVWNMVKRERRWRTL